MKSVEEDVGSRSKTGGLGGLAGELTDPWAPERLHFRAGFVTTYWLNQEWPWFARDFSQQTRLRKTFVLVDFRPSPSIPVRPLVQTVTACPDARPFLSDVRSRQCPLLKIPALSLPDHMSEYPSLSAQSPIRTRSKHRSFLSRGRPLVHILSRRCSEEWIDRSTSDRPRGRPHVRPLSLGHVRT